jgi:apolipoprotein N-acyltransferase
MGTAQSIAPPPARKSRAADESPASASIPWWRSTFAVALAGQLLLWAALPPLELAPLAWLATVPWVMLIRQPALSGKRPYLALWFSSFLFCLAAFYWVTLPHWATTFGWLALSFYLAVYFPLFIGLSRVAVHALRISPLVAAPVVWTGLELARAHLLSGFGMATLSHTQYRWPEIIQISDVFGAYGVSFLIVFVGACLAQMLPSFPRGRAWWPVVPLTAVLAAVLAYGSWRTGQSSTRPGGKVALIQGSIDIEMKYDPSQGQRIFDEYWGLSRQAVRDHGDLDLIVWPETMFRYPWFTFDKDFEPPPDAAWTPAGLEARSRQAVEQTVVPLHTPLLLGIDAVHETREQTERFNTALFLDRDGKVQGQYAKSHLVPFGEYVPLAETFPWLYRLTPLPGGLNRGAGPQSITVGQARYSANICYENTIPHLIRSQVAQLRAENREPDVLVNLTNDGWFWGSTELDMHLACAVFRAVECRKPFLVAANTGFSAWIDSNGQIVSQGRRRATDVIISTPAIDSRDSLYLDHGDLPALLCLVGTVALGGIGLVGWKNRRNERQKPAASGS